MTGRAEDGGAAGRRRGLVGEGGAGIGSGRAAGCRGGAGRRAGTGLVAAGQGERRAGGAGGGSAHESVPGRGAVVKAPAGPQLGGWRVLLGPNELLAAGGSGARPASPPQPR